MRDSAAQYVLDLINTARARANAPPVVLGDNSAAQAHAERSLANCSSSHWGPDGLKPYMRYSLAGGVQYSAENVSGIDYCIRPREGYRRIENIKQRLSDTMYGSSRSSGLLGSPGHYRTIVNPAFSKVNIGLAWDEYNVYLVQQFEGDYVAFEQRPVIHGDLFSMSGITKNGVTLSDKTFGVQLYWDPPPQDLTRGQLARTYCVALGVTVTSLRRPPGPNAYYSRDSYQYTRKLCPDPYEIPSGIGAALSREHAQQLWEDAKRASDANATIVATVPWTTADKWTVKNDSFAVTADLSQVFQRYGYGIYTVVLWGDLHGEAQPFSQYSIFHLEG